MNSLICDAIFPLSGRNTALLRQTDRRAAAPDLRPNPNPGFQLFSAIVGFSFGFVIREPNCPPHSALMGGQFHPIDRMQNIFKKSLRSKGCLINFTFRFFKRQRTSSRQNP